ncbi:MAG: type I-MYXAN CRISPR-associated protein Cas6/Cmx6 [Myxococcota bacterium]
MESSSDFADATFSVTGDLLPIDHGYALFSAVSRLVPQIHEHPAWGLQTIPGRQAEKGLLSLGKSSALRVRLPTEHVGFLFPLIGAQLNVANHELRVGTLTLHPLVPAASLWSKFVTAKGHLEPETFSNQIQTQLAEIEDLGQEPSSIELLVAHRRIMRIKGKKIVGFVVEAHGLEAQASLRLQQVGLGGRRHMGAGLFIKKTRREP